MSVLDGFEAVGEKTTTNKMTMTVMESSVRFSKGVTEARPMASTLTLQERLLP